MSMRLLTDIFDDNNSEYDNVIVEMIPGEVFSDRLTGKQFTLQEYICDNNHCDCKSIAIEFQEIGALDERIPLAMIDYDWSSGTAVVTSNAQVVQSEFAPAVLDWYKNLVADKKYHYQLFLKYKLFKSVCMLEELHRVQDAQSAVRINRNDSCLCGSGKKYKRCCLNKLDLSIVPSSLMGQ